MTGKVEPMDRSPHSSGPGSQDREPPDRPPSEDRAHAGSPGPSPAADSLDPSAGADYVDGVPTFDFVRDRIEGRYATAAGTTELSEETAAGRTLAQQEEDREAAAAKRLEQIRRSMRPE